MNTKKIIIYSLIAIAIGATAYYGYKWYKKSKAIPPSGSPVTTTPKKLAVVANVASANNVAEDKASQIANV